MIEHETEWKNSMTQDTPSRHLDQFVVRMPKGMRDRLKNEAIANGRSLNAEIVSRLHNGSPSMAEALVEARRAAERLEAAISGAKFGFGILYS